MFEDVIESLADEALVLEGYAKDRRKESEQQARQAATYQRSADEKRMAIAVLKSATIVSGTELLKTINRGESPDPE